MESRPLDGAELDRTALPAAPLAETLPTAHPALLTAPTLPPPVPGGAATCRGVGSLWAAGTALLLLWLIACQWHLTRLRRQARPITSGPAADALAALSARPPVLLAHPSVRSPFLSGIRRPAIFLPTTHEADFDQTALRAILAHELAHLEHRDNAWTLAARLLSALLWPQPLLWVLCRRLDQTGEEACDLAVLAQDCPPRAYAACLLTLAERHPLGRRERALGAGVAPFRSSLGQRIGRILDKGTHAMSTVTTRLRLTVAALAVSAALGGAFLISSAPAQSPAPTAATLTPEQQRFNAMRGQDKANLTAISGALTQCVQDHDEYLPDAAHWMDALSPYLKDRSVFFDPFQPGMKRYGYAFNRNCSRKSLASIGYPSEVVFVFDSTLGTRNANDTGQSLRYSDSTRRHTDLLLVDGRVKSTNTDAPPLFTIQPWRPPAHRPSHKAGQPQAPSPSAQARLRQFRQVTLALTAAHPDPELSNARFLAGLTPVQGPGVVVTLNDSKKTLPGKMPPGIAAPSLIHDTDINAVINELKAAGAEAIAVNDQRLVATSPVRCAGPTVFVNNMPIAAPFVIKAIGDPKALAVAMTHPGGIAAQIKMFDSAMFSVKDAGALMLPAYSGGGVPRYAKPVPMTSAETGPQRGTDAELLRSLMQEREQREAQLSALKVQAEALSTQAEIVRKQAEQALRGPAGGSSSAADLSQIRRRTLSRKIVAEQASLAQMKATLTPRHPEVVVAERKLHLLKRDYQELPVWEKQQFVRSVHEYIRSQALSVNALTNASRQALRQRYGVQRQERQLEAEIATLNAQITRAQGTGPEH